jgi:hypothetical protein
LLISFLNFTFKSTAAFEKIEKQFKEARQYLQNNNSNTSNKMSIVKAESFDLSKVTFSDVKLDQHGRKMIYINGESNRILVQTPKMYAPNGIKRWRKKDAVDNKDDKFEMELSFYGEDNTDKNSQAIKAFHEKWQDFDDLIKKAIMERSKEWLGKSKVSMDVVEDKYIPMVRVPKKDDEILPYPHRIRAKLDREQDSNGDFTGRFLSNKRFKTELLLFDENKNALDLNESNAEMVVPKGSQVVCVLECVYLSISTNISVKWKLVQAKVFRKANTITDYAMLDDEESEGAPAENLVQDDLDTDAEGEGEGEAEEAVEAAAEAEAEEEGEEEDEVVEAKPTTATKKRVKRGVSSTGV